MLTGRNAPCPCGSGKKYKHCCLDVDSFGTPGDVHNMAFAADPDRQPDLGQLGEHALVQHRAGRRSEAERLYRQLVRLQPRRADALRLLGALAFQAGHTDHAEKLMRKALAIQPDFVEGYSSLGVVLHARRRYAEAVASYRRALALRDTFAEAHTNLGITLQQQGKLDEAEACHRRAIALDPNYPDAYSNLGILLKELGRYNEAVAAYDRAVALKPDFAEAHNNLAVSLYALKRYEDAVASYERAIELDPAYYDAHINLGLVMKTLKRNEEAIACYRRAIEINPDTSEPYNSLGALLHIEGKLGEALACYDAAIKLDPRHAQAQNGRGAVLRELGRIDEAAACHLRAVRLKPDFADAYRMWAHSQKCTSKDRLIVQKMEALCAAGKLERAEQLLLHYGLGKTYDDLQEYAKAFAHYARANRLDKEDYQFDAAQHSAEVDRTIARYSEAFFIRGGELGDDSEVPVLIVGMMRSGTTLIEQILASHPAVHGAGELGLCEAAEKHFDLEAPGALERENVRVHSQAYLAELRKLNARAMHLTDKLPNNFLRLGFFHLLFPRARIVHCQRHPVDTCLSIYFHKFTGHHPWSYDLEELAFYYREYERVMAHWRRVLPRAVFHEVQYEELVMEQERVSRELVAFCGLPWDAACLQFHKNGRPVRTASSWQVRQPLYASSIERWRRYAPFIGALAQLLKPEGAAQSAAIENGASPVSAR